VVEYVSEGSNYCGHDMGDIAHPIAIRSGKRLIPTKVKALPYLFTTSVMAFIHLSASSMVSFEDDKIHAFF